MDRQKLVIVVLVTLAMGFVVAFALGIGNRDSGNAARPPSLVGALEGLKGKRFLLQQPDNSNCNGDATNVTIPGGCSLTVPKSGLISRPTRGVIRVGNVPVFISLDPEDGPTQEKTLKPGKCVEAVLGRSGGRLTLSCVLPGTCSMTLLRRGCR
jgi:hypothetical protein